MAKIDVALKALNPQQLAVALHHDGALCVLAGAGSGKTATVVARMARMVRDGVPGQRLLAFTFSKKAADEMNARLKQLTDAPARVGTFHSVAYEILRTEKPVYREWTVDIANKYKWCIKDAIGYRGINWKTADLAVLEDTISKFKTELVRPGDAQAQVLAKRWYEDSGYLPTMNPTKVLEAYAQAEVLREERLLLTFDDMLLLANKLLADEATRVRWASRYTHVIQDEAQDAAKPTLTLARALAWDHKNYMIVGDVAQSIYGFRGASPETMISFAEEWGGGVAYLGTNYRSGATILDAANKVRACMKNGAEGTVELVPARADAGAVEGSRYLDFDEEATATVEHFVQLHAQGVAWKDMAALYRLNAQSRALEEAAITAKIPYRVVGSSSFYERREVRDLLAYLRLAQYGRVEDATATLCAPNRYMPKALLEALVRCAPKAPKPDTDWSQVVRQAAAGVKLHGGQESALASWCTLVAELQSRLTTSNGDWTPPKLLEDVILATDYMTWLRGEDGSETVENSRQANVRELVRASGRFLTVAELLHYVDVTQRQARQNGKSKVADAVTFSTVHSSKGLEWSVVALVGANERILPHSLADREEERRLFYVGVTRAKDRLYVSCVRQAAMSAGLMSLEPSQFLTEAGVSVVDRDKIATPSVWADAAAQQPAELDF